MAKINTDIIKKDYGINKIAISSSYITQTVYTDEDNIHEDFDNTLLINNKSKTFIKNTIFDYNNNNETNIDVLNINQSVLNGTNISINNLNNTFIVNTDNSQSTIKSQQLKETTLLNSRNQTQSFFNFPAPSDTEDFVVQPMMISNGERTIWSEGKYGWINTEKINSFTDFKNKVPHDLNGQTITLTLQSNERLENLSSYHNGIIELIGTNASNNVNLDNCSVKIILSGFIFNHLNINNCNTVYLQDCSFDKVDNKNTLIELNSTINPWQFKKVEFNNIVNYCLNSSNSKIFIKNKIRNLNFNNFFLGIHADNNSQIYMIPENTTVGILIKENLSNFREKSSSRPIFMLATNGSIINCDYYRWYNNQYVNKISANIIYPSNLENGYQGNSYETFTISPNQMYDDEGKNYRRVKSLLFSLWSQINNGRVNFALNGEDNNIKQTDKISIPLFGLYQMAKPKLSVSDSPWQLTNNQFHIMSGTKDDHISADGNDEYYLNINHNQTVLTNAEIFNQYNCPSTNIGYENNAVFPYSPSQPHLAHYFSNQPITYSTEDITCSVVPNIITRNLVKQGTINITQMKNYDLSFKGYINGIQKDIYINPNNNSFYIYDEYDKIQYVNEYVTNFISYQYGSNPINNIVKNYFTTSLSNSDVIHNIYYDEKAKNFYYFDSENKIISSNELNNEITSNLYESVYLSSKTENIPCGVTKFVFLIKRPNEVETIVPVFIQNSNGSWALRIGNWNTTVNQKHYNSNTSTVFNYVSINQILQNKNIFTKTVSKKVGKKTITTSYDFKYNTLSGKFYYLDDDNQQKYDLDNSIKNDIKYIYRKVIDVTPCLTNETHSIEFPNRFKVRWDSTGAWFHDYVSGYDENNNPLSTGEKRLEQGYNSNGILTSVCDILNPENSKFYYVTQEVDITEIMKHNNAHFTTYSTIAEKNVDVYYNKNKDTFFYWVDSNHQENINISTFTLNTEEKIGNTAEESGTITMSNEYFCNGSYDITDVVQGEDNKFITYINGKNRIVFYDYESKNFYYYNEDATSTICNDQIDIKQNYIYHNTTQTDITTIPDMGFEATLPAPAGKQYIRYDNTNGYYFVSGVNVKVYQYVLPDNTGNLNVNDYISNRVATITNLNDSGTEVTKTYYYETTDIDITPILVNSFKAIINGEERETFYNNNDNTFFIKDKNNYSIDITDQIINDINWRMVYDSNQIPNVKSLYVNPNYSYITIADNQIYYDDSNNILYTKERIPLSPLTIPTEDGGIIWKDGEQQSDDISPIINQSFEYYYTDEKYYDVYYNHDTNLFSTKINDAWQNITDQILPKLTYYYDGNEINNVINGTATFTVQINGLPSTISYNADTKRFISNETDVTYFITGNLQIYFEQSENITDLIYNQSFFTVQISGKDRDVYYSPFLNNNKGQFYLDKLDKTDQFSSFISCFYLEKDITNVFKANNSFKGVYVNDNDEYIQTDITYNGNNSWVDNQEDITDNIISKISESKTFIRKYNFQDEVDDRDKSFDGIVSTYNGEEFVNQQKRKLYWDNNLTSLYYLDDKAISTVNDDIKSSITYKYKTTIIDWNVIHGDESFTTSLEDSSLNVYVKYNKTNGTFYYENGTQKIDITDQIINQWTVLFNGDLTIDFTQLRFGNNKTYNIPFSTYNLYYKIDNNEDNYYYINGIEEYTLNNDIISNLTYSYKNNDITDAMVSNISFKETIDDKELDIFYKKKENKDFFYYIDNISEIDVTEIILPLIKCTFNQNVSNYDITHIFKNQNESLNLNNFGNVYFIPLSGYYIAATKFLIDGNNYRVNYTITNGYFYNEEVEITSVINGSVFPFEILREIYYDNKYKQYKYVNNCGQNIDVTDNISPHINNKYYYNVKKNNYIDITNAIYNNQSFNTKWKPSYPKYFDYLNRDESQMNPRNENGSINTEFGKKFYYFNNSTRVYDNEGDNKGKHIASAVYLSTYYYGNLLDISNNISRQSFNTYVIDKKANYTIYYDIFGGKTKNLGVYYWYNNKGVMQNITKQVSTYVKQQYFYNGMNITDTVRGAHFDYKTTYTMYFDQLTGRFYYLKGNVYTIPSSNVADKKNANLVYYYTSKLDLTKMKQAGSAISAFYSFLNNDISTSKRLTFTISKKNVLTIKFDKTNVTNSLPTSYINGHYYLDFINIKNVPFYDSKWFFTPIDGITRRVRYRKWTKKLGKFDWYYKCNKKKIICTEKILSHINYYHQGENIDNVVKGASFKTMFEGTILNGPVRKVYYDRHTKEYYFEDRQYLTTDQVASNIWVDITNARDFAKKWCFLAWINNSVREVYYNKKNNYYYYIEKNKNIQIPDRNEIEGTNYFFTENGDDRNYYHNENLSSYMLWDNYLKVMVNGKIIDVYKNQQSDKKEGEDYYYVTKRTLVNHILEPRITKKFIYQGQSITNSVYPNPNTNLNLAETDYNVKFNASILTGIGDMTSYTNHAIWYHPSAGFYFSGSKLNATKLTGTYKNRPVNDQICQHLTYYYYDRDNNIQYDITRYLDSTTPFTILSGEKNYNIYSYIPENEVYSIVAPISSLHYPEKNDTRRIHKRKFYYLDQNKEKIDITKDIVNNLTIRYKNEDITRVINDGYNYFVAMDAGYKRFVYYNPVLSTFYYYKDNEFTRNLKFDTEISNHIIPKRPEAPQYFCYTSNISEIQQDIANKKRFFGTSQEDIFYDFNTKDFFYYTNEQHTQKEIVTQYIQPYLTEEYAYAIEGQVYNNITNVLNGKTNMFLATIDGVQRLIKYDRQRETFTYVYDTEGKYNTTTILTPLHNEVEMVCSNTNDSKNIEIASKIDNSKLYQDIYKLKV